MSEIRIFFDTNVLVYAHDETAIFHHESATLLNLVLETNSFQGVIGEQNLVELYRIITNKSAMTGKPLSSNDAKKLIQQTYLSGNFEIVYPTIDSINETLDLAVKLKKAGGRRQRAEGSFQKGIQRKVRSWALPRTLLNGGNPRTQVLSKWSNFVRETPPEKEPPNFQFGSVLKPLLPTVVAEDKVQFPSASCPLPSAFLDKCCLCQNI